MPLVVPVKFTYASKDLWFDPQGLDIVEADYAICRTERGTEIGLVTRNPFEVSEEELAAPLKPVLRIASDEDLDRADELARKGDEAMSDFRRLVKKNGLDMKPVGVEYLFGGEKLIFYFAAEDRVDFRQLVRDLSSCFHTRVDMRQIGVRDETRLMGGYAQCGQELCCTRFGGNFEPVSIRMAKEQDLPLNSSKISGVCGRLMCCLRYEFEAYKDFKGRAPKKKAVIDTPLGKARIQEYNTPREQIVLRLENGKSFTVNLADMTCSEAAQKRADEQGYTCRPDCVTRDVLDRIDSPDMRMALLELDRKNGVDVGDGVDSADLIDTSGSSEGRSSSHGRQGTDSSSSSRSDRNRSSKSGQDRSHGQGQGRSQGQGSGGSRSQGQGQSGQGKSSGGEGSGGRRRRYSSGSSSSDQRGTATQQGSRNSAQNASGRQSGQGSQSSTSRRRRQHVSEGSGGQAGAGVSSGQRAEGGASGASDQTASSRPRKHTTASGGTAQGGTGKPSVPSVADQVAEGDVKVSRRHPGDGGGSRSGSSSGASSGSGSRSGSRSSSGSVSASRGQNGTQGQSHREDGGQQQTSSSSGQQSQRRRRHRSSGSQPGDGAVGGSAGGDGSGSPDAGGSESGSSGGLQRSDGDSSRSGASSSAAPSVGSDGTSVQA